MLPRLLTRLPVVGLDLAFSAPVHAARLVVPPAGAAVRSAVDLAGTGVRTTVGGAAAATATAVRVGRVARQALAGPGGPWQAGKRLQFPLRPRPQVAHALEDRARKVAALLAEHPDVLTAYWDGGLGRLVVQVTEDAVTDRVADRAGRLAADHQLDQPEDRAEEGPVHPGDVRHVRAAVAALACDAAGVAAALTARTAHLRSAPRLVTALVTLAREDSRVRSRLAGLLGPAGADLALTAVNAAAHGIGQAPTALLLDAALRGSQLAAAVARAAAFDAAHDTVCVPDRTSPPATGHPRPPLAALPGETYADQAVTGSVVGAATTLLFTRDMAEAAEAVLAGSPKAARYGPAAFTAALGTALARDGVLVRDPDRLRRLECVDTVVLHPEALRGTRRTVLDVHPNVPGWDHDRLWQAATAALRPPGEAPPDGAGPALDLRPVPDAGPLPAEDATGLMIATAAGEDVGTVLVGRELDPRAEAVLGAARRAGLRVIVADDPALEDFRALADEVAGAERPLDEIVAGLHRQGHVVLAVARVPAARHPAPGRAGLDPEADRLRHGLLRADLAVAVTDEHSAVLWDADLLALDGLQGVWRLLTAVPAARTVSRHARIFAQAGAALSELLVITRGRRPHHAPRPAGFRLSPVNAAAAAALLSGWRAALTVATRPVPHPRPRVHWHALEPAEALDRIAAVAPRPPSGPAAVRAKAAGAAGALARLPVLTPVRITAHLAGAVRAELDDPLTPVLTVGAAASALLGSTIDALLVAGALGINATVGGVQRLRAERALAALAVGQRRKARRVGEAGATTVDAARLRPGDIIELGTADVVPADGRLLEADGLEVDESSLTGESLPTAKHPAATPRATVADRRCMVYEGTTVVAGRARAVVVGTGEQTEAGRAATLAARAPAAAGVQVRLRRLTSKVVPLTLAGGAVVTGLSLLRGRPVRDAVGGGVAVAVAAVPEGLPLVATVAQMAAARRLSRHGVLVRAPRTLEALGRMDTICFDKTGTLTENRLHVVTVVTADGTTAPSGAGAAAVLRPAARACPRKADDTGAHAHATDEAVLTAAPPDPDWHPLAQQPFEASRGYAAAVGRPGDAAALLVVKGAPEVVLPACRRTAADPERVVQKLARQGLRIIAVARRAAGRRPAADVLAEPLADLELLGFIGLADAPRAGSAPLIAALRQAGVRPVMLTGDHPQTARAVAVALGWPPDVTVATGDRLAALDRDGRAALLRDCDVVARVAPEQKLQVVEALQAAGRVVAMVGDGANDAAAIRTADIGVGIAARGSAAARNAADLVLTGDELLPLLEAVAEGRALWHSVADAVSMLLGGNAGEVGFTVLGTLLSGASPLSTRQLLLVNLLTDMFPAMALAVTPQDRPGPDEGTGDTGGTGVAALGAPLTRQIRRRGVIAALGATTAWLIGTLTPGSARRTSTMALCGLVGAQLAQTVVGRRRSPLVLGTVLGSAVVLAALVQTPGVSHFFGCTPLGPVAWAGVAVALGAAVLAPKALPAAEERLLRQARRLRRPTATGRTAPA
ncbi:MULTISPECIES: cation-translocating P-type ATPase [Streptomycetaceae]|uniref:Transport ATPase n=1 Tax=Streptantibioticus cattleyicolor (strain ATCC 35852 / DSM 46488 / JCM 4925 / NBRC 14057 / NRRL 8057) TaxID=1003195 RepID=F8JSP9_STREN|nr:MULTISPECIES: cation-translocating P-type ATPase [Streptomycetaceae]AEW97955.1 transport ATPase [Streptantibioticus cattleyicolor NRRL 8057 = DSM 46488]MYS62358.1 HAD-IC family P-type ATPase [Streptomyces sp. SID5468]CCB78273.1 putative cation-transporting ATPase I [Streptantibioticus cattleyicolor NRRL 8057 = DSM 46488]